MKVEDENLSELANPSMPDKRRKTIILSTFIIIFVQLVILVLLVIFSPALFRSVWLILVFFSMLTLALGLIAISATPGNSQLMVEPAAKFTAQEAAGVEKSVRDPLTNLFSRYYLEETLQRELHRSLRNHTSLGIIMLELDHFKQLTSTYGVTVGNMLLKKLAHILQESIRGSDITCRYAGEKFVLMIGDAARDLALERAEHIRARVENIKLNYDDQEIKGVTISSGVSIYPEHGTTIEALLKNADDALQYAKSRGYNQVVLYQKKFD